MQSLYIYHHKDAFHEDLWGTLNECCSFNECFDTHSQSVKKSQSYFDVGILLIVGHVRLPGSSRTSNIKFQGYQ